MTLAPAPTAVPRRVPASAATPLADFVAASGLRALVLAPSTDPNRKVTVLLVPPEGGRAVLAIKVPTTGRAARAVDVERRVLLALRDATSWEGLRAVPAVRGTVAHDGRLALVVEAVPGVPMTTSYLRWRHTARPERVRADFAAVATWLAGFQRATAGPAEPLELDGVVSRRLWRRFGRDPLVDGDLERLAGLCAQLRRDAVPRTAVHGDFWPGNVLLHGGRVGGVVDWEAGSIAGEPVRDLVRFANMYALYLDRRTRPGRRVAGHPGLRAGAWGAALEYAIEGAGWFPDLYRSFLREGLRRLGASPDGWRAAALAGIAEVAAVADDEDFARRHLELFRRLRAAGRARGALR